MEPKITGYRLLTETEVELMNEAKALSIQCGVFIEKLRLYGDRPPWLETTMPELDQRWVGIGESQLQQGFMAVIRSIARPTTF
jgi:hypothetical protein